MKLKVDSGKLSNLSYADEPVYNVEVKQRILISLLNCSNLTSRFPNQVKHKLIAYISFRMSWWNLRKFNEFEELFYM